MQTADKLMLLHTTAKCRYNKKFELMLTERAKAYSSSCSQTVSLYSSHFVAVHFWSVRYSQKSQKINKTPYFGSSGSFKVIDVDTTEKFVTKCLL